MGILGLKFENNIVIIEISALEFVLMQSLVLKSKSLNLEPKLCDLGTLELGLESAIIII